MARLVTPHPPGRLDERLLAAATDAFTFALISDRTGLARPGVFERGIETVNALRPRFAIQLGDLIEGYTTQAAELSAQWADVDAILDRLEVPLVCIPGNHDISNRLMRDVWLSRYGHTYCHFWHQDILFLLLDTQDGHATLPAEVMAKLAELKPLFDVDPEAGQRALEQVVDWEATMPVAISDEQVAYFERVLAEGPPPRWTFLLMHMPAWQGDEHPGLRCIRGALGRRPYTMFAGHVHNYRRCAIEGRDHIRLGPTGGTWVISGERGNFDHVTLVHVRPDGDPVIANVLLEGVRDVAGEPIGPIVTAQAETRPPDAALG